MGEHIWQDVPKPRALGGGRYRPRWNSVALFFNFTDENRPDDYQETSVQAVRAWLDQGGAPAIPPVSEFMANHWGTLSYGKFAFGLVTPTRSGEALIPRLRVPKDDKGNPDPHDYVGLMRQWIARGREEVWRAAGSLEKEGRRFIPSIVLVHRYWSGAWAWGGWTQTLGGVEYEIGRITHMPYYLTFVGDDPEIDPPEVPPHRARTFWQTLAHEYAHNFLDFGDLYGPSGCTGYWDLLGDHNVAGRMSEVSAVHKARVGWLRFRRVIQGPHAEDQELSLRPYTTTGDAIKIVPDPRLNPHEYFVLEYRRRTGDELWVPDRGVGERGLLITHFNDRLDLPPTWLNRECPYFDPEFADFSDRGTALWTGWDRLDGVLFTGTSGRDRFTPESQPSSALYGPRRSGVHITAIRVRPERVTFRVRIDLRPARRPGTVQAVVGSWLCGDTDRGVAGRFTTPAPGAGAQIAMRNGRSLALLHHGQGQWLVHARQHLEAGGWSLRTHQVHRVGDFDGDGHDEIFARTTAGRLRMAVLKWGNGGFTPIASAATRVGAWALPADAHSLPANLDGRGHSVVQFAGDRAAVLRLANGSFSVAGIQSPWIDRWFLRPNDHRSVGRFTQAKLDEIVLRSDNWLGLLGWNSGEQRLRLRSIQEDRVDDWDLAPTDRHTVGDFDGDGLDEIYIRSAGWAGVLKWTGDRFSVAWIRRADIVHWLDGGDPPSLALAANDSFQAARLFPERDTVLHRAGSTFSVLSWEEGEMRLRQQLASPFHGRWTLGSTDRLLIGDFHGVGPDVADSMQDYIQDGIDDIFLHAGRGTAMLGAHHVPDDNSPGGVQDFFGLTWVSGRTLLPQR
ncbi:MAG: hypothetical protein ACRD2Z_17305 [Thermoanaerobaculia bacterium]